MLWSHWISTSFSSQTLESTKISTYEPVSSRKYENRYRTKICNFTVSCLSAIRDNLLLFLWPSKRKPRHCGESTWEKRPGQRDKVPSVPVSCNCGWFESCSCWFLESASEVKQRENDEKLKSLAHYIVFCGKPNILLRGHPNEKVNQATVSRLSSASNQ